MLSAGTNVQWLVEDLGILDSPADEPRDAAATVTSTDGVIYVPALLGLGTPHWDFGARGTLLGITGGRRPRTSCAPCSTASRSAPSTSSRRPRATPA